MSDGGDVEVVVPPPPSEYGSREEFLDACEREVCEGLYNRSAQATIMLPVCFERGDYEGVREMLTWLVDDVAERKWLERVGNDGDGGSH